MTTNDYDPVNGNLDSVSQTLWSFLNGPQLALVTYYQYDGRGLLTKETDPRGNSSQTGFTTLYQDYNRFGEAQTVLHWVDNTHLTKETYGYNSFGYLTSYIDANGYSSIANDPNPPVAADHQTTYTVDILGRRTNTEQPIPKVGDIVYGNDGVPPRHTSRIQQHL